MGCRRIRNAESLALGVHRGQLTAWQQDDPRPEGWEPAYLRRVAAAEGWIVATGTTGEQDFFPWHEV